MLSTSGSAGGRTYRLSRAVARGKVLSKLVRESPTLIALSTVGQIHATFSPEPEQVLQWNDRSVGT